jgi:mRNA interferase RelE/StbE
MEYRIFINKKAVKALEKIPEPYYANIKKAIYQLSNDPRPTDCKKLKGREAYRIRVGDYRIIYDISDKLLVVEVIALGHRRDIYK